MAVQQRVREILSKQEYQRTTVDKVRFKKRIRQLRALVGTYSYEDVIYNPTVSHVRSRITAAIRRVTDTPPEVVLRTRLINGRRLGRFLINELDMNPDEVATVLEGYIQGSFRLSCRFNDLVRIQDTPHYGTCLKNWRGVETVRYLADPDMVVIFVPDSSGKMQARVLARALFLQGEFVLGLYKVYGNGLSHQAVVNALADVIPCHPLQTGRTGQKVSSWSQVRNPILKSPIWCDHTWSFSSLTNTMQFYV